MPSKRHHLVPEFYLEFFADRSGRRPVVWVYDKDSPAPRPQLPKDTAIETHFHTVQLPDGTRTDRLERSFSKIETIAAPILARWVEPRYRMRPEEIAEIAYFLGLIHGRVRRSVEAGIEWVREFVVWWLQRLASDPERYRESYARFLRDSPGLDAPPVEEMLALSRDPERHFRFGANPQFALGMGMLTIKDVARQLLTMNWCLCTAPRSTFFVTSDTPLTIFRQSGPLASFGGGLALPDVEVAFPISPEICLFVDRRHREDRRRVSRSFVSQINRRVAFGAERIVISHLKARRVERLVREAAQTRQWPKWGRTAVRRWLDTHAEEFARRPGSG